MQLPCVFTCSLLLVYAAAAAADEVILPNNEMDSYEEERAKRPFCNAFTGCGKKRSEVLAIGRMPLPMARTLGADLSNDLHAEDPMGALLDAEPAVAELSRQILSEAKLWEAIQEARDELRRKEATPRRVGGLRSFRQRRSPSPTSLNRMAENTKTSMTMPVAAQ